MRFKHLLLFIVLSLSTQLFSQTSQTFPVKLRPTSTVTIIGETESPTGDYLILGEVSVTSREYDGIRGVIGRLKGKAMDLGAQALMNFQVDKFQRVRSPGLIETLLAEEGEVLTDEIVNYQTVTATAIAYIEDARMPKKILKQERFFKVGEEAGFDPIIQIDYSWGHDSLGLAFGTKQGEQIYEEQIKPYSKFHIYEESRGVSTSYDEYKKIASRSYSKIQGEFVYKRMKFTYKSNQALSRIKIIHYPENYADRNQVEFIGYDYELAPNIPSGRYIYKKKKTPILRENWSYNRDVTIASKNYFKGKEKTPFLFCELKYYTQEEWDLLVKQYQVKR